jgi:hypothetical protein
MKWTSDVEFRDLLKDFDRSKDEKEEIKRIKPIWIDRFNQYEELKQFVPDLKKVRTLSQFNRWLDMVYDYCDDNNIWVKL